MPHSDRDAAYLWDMVRAAHDAQECVRGVSLTQLLRHRLRTLALERALEILGEAARRVSEDFRAKHPEIGWRGMIGLRNVISHQYGEIDYRRLYEAVTIQLVEDGAVLERLVRRLEASSDGTR